MPKYWVIPNIYLIFAHENSREKIQQANGIFHLLKRVTNTNYHKNAKNEKAQFLCGPEYS